MTISERFLQLGEYGAAGMYEEPDRSLFYRKCLGLRRHLENVALLPYNGGCLYPCGNMKDRMDKIVNPTNWDGMTIQSDKMPDKELADLFIKEFHKYDPRIPEGHTVAGYMSLHSIPHYERVVNEGFLSYIPRIKKIQDTDMRDGLLHLLEGIRCWLERSVAYLRTVNADPKLIEALTRVPMYPAGNIYEAVVAWNFVMYLDGCDNVGRLPAGLLPYYDGTDVTELLRSFFHNICDNRVNTMILGEDDNPLNLQCLEASKGKFRPMIELLVDENTPDDLWEKALEVVRSGNGQPAFYNKKALLGGLQKKLPCITDEDMRHFCGAGCTEPMIAGMSNVGSCDAGINLLLILEACMYEKLESCDSFEAFYDFYLTAVADVVEKVTAAVSKAQLDRAKYNPVPMRTLLVDDCIDRGLDFNNGGARYKWSIINFAGLINVIDSLLSIKEQVFDKKELIASQMLELLKTDDTAFAEKCRRVSMCYGKDIPQVNAFAKKLSADIFSLLEDKKPGIGEAFLPASIQFMSQASAGAGIGATPDGRRKGAPLCDSLGAIFGKDTAGPTALLNSVTALDLQRAIGVPVLNFNINPDFGNDVLKALIMGYIEQGGIQMQISCISREMLEEAYKNPEEHKNLIVRVGGYSDYFCRLSDGLKRMIIDRTIQNGL